MSNKVVSLTFRHIIDDVIANVRQDFEDMGIEKEVLEELQRSWEAKLVATQVTEFDGANGSVPGARPPVQYTTTPGVASTSTSTTARATDAKPAKTESKEEAASADGKSASSGATAGTKRKHEDDDDAASNEIGSDLDDSEEEDADGNEDMMLCLYDKVQRVKNKWKCVLRDGVASIGGRDYLFSKCNGCVGDVRPADPQRVRVVTRASTWWLSLGLRQPYPLGWPWTMTAQDARAGWVRQVVTYDHGVCVNQELIL